MRFTQTARTQNSPVDCTSLGPPLRDLIEYTFKGARFQGLDGTHAGEHDAWLRQQKGARKRISPTQPKRAVMAARDELGRGCRIRRE